MQNVPTLDESGLKGFEIGPWFGLSGPAGIPAAAVERIHAAAVASLKSPDVLKVINDIGGSTVGNSPQEFSLFIKNEIPRWAALVKESGVKVE
jgi:tripartite-type tricarboxylate transporter receptor subunit TctC